MWNLKKNEYNKADSETENKCLPMRKGRVEGQGMVRELKHTDYYI